MPWALGALDDKARVGIKALSPTPRMEVFNTAEADRKIAVTIVGPCHPHSDGFGDDVETQELVVEVQVRSDSLITQDFTYGLRVWVDLKYPDSTTLMRWGSSHARCIYTHQELQEEAQRLGRFKRYMEKLPVRPRGITDLLATVLAYEKASTVRLTVYKDHRSRPEVHEDAAVGARACYLLAKRLQDLGKKEAA